MQNVVPKLDRTPGEIKFTGRNQIDADREEILSIIKQNRSNS